MTHGLHLEVIGTGSYLPPEVLDNSHFTGRLLNAYGPNGEILRQKVLDDKTIVSMSGIRERRRAPANELPSDLGYRAAVDAIERAGINVDSLVGIIFGSVTESTNFPSGACKIQERLGARNCHIAYDINHACAAFGQTVSNANAHVLRTEGTYLCVVAECLTRTADPTDINSYLSGDGAGAVVLRPTNGPRGIIGEYSKSDPHEGKLRHIFRDAQGFLRMPDGKIVLNAAIREMVDSAVQLKLQVGWDRADVYIPHQANGRILDGVEKRVSADGAIVYRNIDRWGNMASATCAVALDEAVRDKTIKQSQGEELGSRVIITSFASGLVTSAVAIQF